MSPVSTRYGIDYPLGTETPDVDGDITKVVQGVEALAAQFGQGPLSSRPVSTPGSPGKQGRFYVVTSGAETGQLHYDYGTGWIYLNVPPSGVAPDSITQTELAANSVGNSELQDNAVSAAEIADGQITWWKAATDLKPSQGAGAGSETLRALGTGAGNAAAGNDARFTDQRVPTDNSVNAAKIVDGTVGNAELADGSVTSNKIANLNVGVSQLADNSVNAAKIQDGTVGAAEIADLSVGTAELADNAVTLLKMADSSVGSAEIVDGSVGSIDLDTKVRPQAVILRRTTAAANAAAYDPNEWETELLDGWNGWAAGDPTRVYVPAAGVYRVHQYIAFLGGTGSSNTGCRVWRYNSAHAQQEIVCGTGVDGPNLGMQHSCSGLAVCVTGDYFLSESYQAASGTAEMWYGRFAVEQLYRT